MHSGKKRAQQTAEIFTAIIAGEFPVEAIDGLGPNDSVEDFAKKLVDWGEDILVVGHLPFMANLASLLITGVANRPVVTYAPGSVICLEHTGDSDWKSQWMIRPELLNDA